MMRRILSIILLCTLRTLSMGLNAMGQIFMANAQFWHIALANVAEEHDKKYGTARVVVLQRVDEEGEEYTKPNIPMSKVVN